MYQDAGSGLNSSSSVRRMLKGNEKCTEKCNVFLQYIVYILVIHMLICWLMMYFCFCWKYLTSQGDTDSTILNIRDNSWLQRRKQRELLSHSAFSSDVQCQIHEKSSVEVVEMANVGLSVPECNAVGSAS